MYRHIRRSEIFTKQPAKPGHEQQESDQDNDGSAFVGRDGAIHGFAVESSM